MINAYKVRDLEAKGPGLSKRLKNLEECKREGLLGLLQNGVIMTPNKLEEMLNEAYNQGVRDNQLEIQRTLGLR